MLFAALPDLSSSNLQWPAVAVVVAVATLGYLLSRARLWGHRFTVLDAALLVTCMAAGTAAAVPIVEAVSTQAKSAALLQCLATFRERIELYRAEHQGNAPLLYQGTLPQLTMATDAQGVPGHRGKRYPYGPYLPNGIPANPLTSVRTITATDVFPPRAASGTGGWLYHEASGQIVPDSERFLDK